MIHLKTITTASLIAALIGTANAAPLHKAAAEGDTAAIHALLDARADIEAKNEDGDTPLHIAAYNSHAEAIRTLLAAGADIEAKIKNGKTPLQLATERGHAEAIRILRNATK